MQYLVHFWYLRSLPWAWGHYKSTLAGFEAQIAVQATWKNIGKPLFQDYTLQGKVIGFFLRLFRILGGLFFYFVLGLLYIILYLLWIFLPILSVVSILGFFFADSPQHVQEVIHTFP